MTGETVIGLWHDIETSRLITINELVYEMTGFNNLPFTWKQVCDMRYTTCLVQFNYDPYTGEKIDWKHLKNNFEEYAKRNDKPKD